MSTIKTINLQHPSSASNNLVLDSSGNVTGAGTLAMASSFLRNRIINGDMRIAQRGTSFTPTVNSYTLDRWQAITDSGARYTVAQSSVAPDGFINSILFTSTGAYTPGTNEVHGVWHPIEGFNVADLGWGTAAAQTITLSFRVRSSLTGTFGGTLNNTGYVRAYPFTYTINAANTWETKTITIPGDTTGTWNTTNGIGLNISFGLGCGSGRSAAAGAWGANVAFSATGAVNFVGTNGATFYLTGVQLEVGSVATPFERRQYGQELALCQRYYISTPDAERALKRSYNWSGATLAINVSADFPVTMRASPTMSVFGDISDGSQISLGAAGVGSNINCFTAFTTINNGQFLDFHYYRASAEL